MGSKGQRVEAKVEAEGRGLRRKMDVEKALQEIIVDSLT